MKALKLKEDEEVYGAPPEAKIIPISPKARDYLLKQVTRKLPKKVVAIRPSKGERHNPRLITELYDRFIAPYYPSVIRASRQFFLRHTIPFLVNAMSANAAAVLSGAFFKRHAKVFNDCGKDAHMRQTLIAVASHPLPDLPPHVEQAMAKLKTERQREALRIIANLATERPEFYLSSRDLQARLLLPTAMTAYRILERLCRVGAIERLTRGQSRVEASREGNAATAATFRLKPKP